MITIEINGGSGRILDRLPSGPIRLIHGECSYQLQGYEHMRRNNRKWNNWDGYIRLFHKSHRTFPVGLLPIVKRVLEENQIEYIVKYSDWTQCRVDLQVDNKQFPLRPYQMEAVMAAVEKKMGVIRVATGGGKTIIAGHIAAAVQLPTLFLVHTRDLLYQGIDMFRHMFGDEKVGQVGDGMLDFREITVATMQTMSRVFGVEYERYEYDDDEDWRDDSMDITERDSHYIRSALNSIGVVFVDECHRVAAPTAMRIMESLVNPRFRIGLSASPWRDDGADLAIEACLGDICYSASASDLTPEYLVPPIIRIRDVPAVGFPRGANYNQIYSQYIIHNGERNAKVVASAVSMIHRQKPTMVLVTRINHGEILQNQISEALGFRVPFISGRDSSITRKSVLDDMRNGRLGCFIASVIADEGLDIKPLQGLVLAGAGKSSTKALQRVGRLLRPYKGKVDAEVVDFNDNARYLVEHSARRQQLYYTEDKWDVIDY